MTTRSLRAPGLPPSSRSPPHRPAPALTRSSGPGIFGDVVVQAFCPAAGAVAVRVDLGDRDDSATVSLVIPVAISGGPGSDELRGGSGADQLGGDAGDDTVAGGDGPDVLTGGLGADAVSGDAGDDDIRVRDGIRDIVRCAAGTDTVDADTLDEIDADCEAVTRTSTTAAVPATPTDRALHGDRLRRRLRDAEPRRPAGGAERRPPPGSKGRPARDDHRDAHATALAPSAPRAAPQPRGLSPCQGGRDRSRGQLPQGQMPSRSGSSREAPRDLKQHREARCATANVMCG